MPKNQAQAPLTPPLKWAGGKRWLVPTLEKLWRPHQERRLVEPFCGSLSVALGLQPRRALLNDINPHLYNLYRHLKKGLTHGEVEMRYDKDHYYRCRDRFNELIQHGEHQTPEAALLFYLLNRTGFNGLCRFNSSGGFNIPFGKHKTVNFIDDFDAYRRRFRGWTFSNKDFSRLKIDQDADFVYIDMPYDGTFDDYSAGGFSWDDHLRLGEWAAHLNCPVVISNAATPRVRSLYRRLGFKMRTLDAPRSISCNGDRSKAKEVLAANF
jgi:DNA adenine methylase